MNVLFMHNCSVNMDKRKKDYPTYEEAQRIVQKEGIKRWREYKARYKELGLPAGPEAYYKDSGWIDIYDFLGTSPNSLPSYEEAKQIVQKKGIKSGKEYRSIAKAIGLPVAPEDFYKGKGWIDWYDFLGRERAWFACLPPSVL